MVFLFSESLRVLLLALWTLESFAQIEVNVAGGVLANDDEASNVPVQLACSTSNSAILAKIDVARNECCSRYQQQFEAYWWFNASFFGYLQTMQSWNCSQLRQICANQTYNFTEYHSLAYEYVCDWESFSAKCATSLKQQESLNTEDTLPDPLNACEQLAQSNGTVNEFVEIISAITPFCDTMIWCGYHRDDYLQYEISPWHCMPERCKARLMITIFFVALISVAIIVGNATVIYVITLQEKKRRRSQELFKLSLAVADLLTGVVVYPCFAANMYLTYVSRRQPTVHPLPAITVDRGILAGANLTANYEDGLASDGRYEVELAVNRQYMDCTGFFTILSFSVSIYTLMLASYDRFFAIAKPLRYKKMDVKKISRISILIVWVIGLLMAFLPIVVPGASYNVVVAVFIIPTGFYPIVTYAILLIIPLLIVWGLNIGTFCAANTRGHDLRARSNQSNRRKEELKMARTLALMVTGFTLSLLPTVLVIVASFFLNSIYVGNPENLIPEALSTYSAIELACGLVLAANSLWNPIIYSARNAAFRAETRKLYSLRFKGKRCRCRGFCAICSKQQTTAASAASDATITTVT